MQHLLAEKTQGTIFIVAKTLPFHVILFTVFENLNGKILEFLANKIALALWALAILLVFEKFSSAYLFQIACT